MLFQMLLSPLGRNSLANLSRFCIDGCVLKNSGNGSLPPSLLSSFAIYVSQYPSRLWGSYPAYTGSMVDEVFIIRENKLCAKSFLCHDDQTYLVDFKLMNS